MKKPIKSTISATPPITPSPPTSFESIPGHYKPRSRSGVSFYHHWNINHVEQQLLSSFIIFSVNDNMIKLAIIILFSFVLTACDLLGGGNNIILKQVYNTNKEKKAVLFLKENGATSDNSLQVSILSSNHELGEEEAGNVFTVDSNHDSTRQNENSINILWISIDTLKIEYDKRLRTFVKESKLEGTTILYEPT